MSNVILPILKTDRSKPNIVRYEGIIILHLSFKRASLVFLKGNNSYLATNSNYCPLQFLIIYYITCTINIPGDDNV